MSIYTEADLRGYIYTHLISLQKGKELSKKQTQIILFHAKRAVYELLECPHGWPKGDYLAVFWYGGILEIFSIHETELKRLVDKRLYNPLSKRQKQKRLI